MPSKNNNSSNGNVNSNDVKKQTNGKKKTQGKMKSNSDTTTSNLARTILHNLNIFGEFFFSLFKNIIIVGSIRIIESFK